MISWISVFCKYDSKRTKKEILRNPHHSSTFSKDCFECKVRNRQPWRPAHHIPQVITHFWQSNRIWGGPIDHSCDLGCHNSVTLFKCSKDYNPSSWTDSIVFKHIPLRCSSSRCMNFGFPTVQIWHLPWNHILIDLEVKVYLYKMDWTELHILGSLCHPDGSMKTYTTMKQSTLERHKRPSRRRVETEGWSNQIICLDIQCRLVEKTLTHQKYFFFHPYEEEEINSVLAKHLFWCVQMAD